MHGPVNVKVQQYTKMNQTKLIHNLRLHNKTDDNVDWGLNTLRTKSPYRCNISLTSDKSSHTTAIGWD